MTPAENTSVQPDDDFSAYEDSRRAAKESEAAEVEETEAKPEPAPESDPEVDDQEQDEQDDQEEQPLKGRRLQKRFSQLTAEIRDLKAQIASRESGVATPAGEEKQAPRDPAAKPQSSEFETYGEYEDALIEWKLEQREQRREVVRAHQERAEAYNGRVAELKKQPDYADWDDVFEAVKAKDVALPAPFAEALNSDPHAAELSYYLAKNLKEANRIVGLPPIAAIRELGKLSARFDKAPDPKSPPVSKAPTPIRPVSSAKSASGEKSLNDETDFAAYEKRRMRELRRR